MVSVEIANVSLLLIALFVLQTVVLDKDVLLVLIAQQNKHMKIAGNVCL